MTLLRNQISSPTNQTIGTSNVEILPTCAGSKYARTQVIFTNTSGVNIITIVKGENPAVAGTGIILQPNGSYIESTDQGFNCYQGPFQAVSNGAGSTLSIVEGKEVN